MSIDATAHNVLQNRYGLSNFSLENLQNAGGFSGASIFRIQLSDASRLCLRCWPKSYPDQETLRWIHQAMIHGRVVGSPVIPSIKRTGDQATFASANGRLWELTDWMPGVATFHRAPSTAKLSNAVSHVAACHRALAQVQLDFRIPVGLQLRVEELDQLPAFLSQLESEIVRGVSSSLTQPTTELLNAFRSSLNRSSLLQLASRSSSALRATPLPVQPVVKDLWHDHLLFEGDELTGIIDFGSMGMDSVVLDLSRMLRSLLGADSEQWKLALSEYSRTRSLMEAELALLPALDSANVILSAVNWLKWLVIEQRHFESAEDVAVRLQLVRQNLIEQLESGPLAI